MFSFGDSEATAQVFLEMACSESGFDISKPLDEQSEPELATSLTLARMAVKLARRAGSSPECVEILLKWHDEAFQALVEGSERFKGRAVKRMYPDLRGDKDFYAKIAKEA